MSNRIEPGGAHRPGRPRKDGSARRVLTPGQRNALAALDVSISEKLAALAGMDEDDANRTGVAGQWQFLVERRRTALAAWGVADDAGE